MNTGLLHITGNEAFSKRELGPQHFLFEKRVTLQHCETQKQITASLCLSS